MKTKSDLYDDLSEMKINLDADPDIKIAMTIGQTIGGVEITETRMYSIAELRKLVGKDQVLTQERTFVRDAMFERGKKAKTKAK